MTAADIAAALKGKRNGSGFMVCCPVHDDKNPSLSLQDGDNGKVLVTCFAGCDRLAVIDALKKRGLWNGRPRGDCHTDGHQDRGDPKDVNRVVHLTENPNMEKARKIWSDARPANGIAQAYFRNRGITLHILKSIKESPALLHAPTGEHFPALVCAVQNATGKVVAIQRIYLTRDGTRKANVSSPKMSLGPVGGGAVRLGPAQASIGIAEGVETVLSAMQMYDGTVWACLGGANMANLVLPANVKHITVYGDSGDAGRRAGLVSVLGLLRSVSSGP